MLDRRVHALHRSPELLWLVRALLVPELTANGDYHFRPAVSDSLGVDWGYLHHQESHYYGGSVSACNGGLSVVSLWIPLVDVDEKSGCLSLVRGSHRHGLVPWEGAARGVPGGVERYGEVVAEPMRAGDVLALHNLTLHATSPNERADRIRWSIDLRYMATGTGYAWHQLGEDFDRQLPGFVVASETPALEQPFAEWQAKWREAPQWQERWVISPSNKRSRI